MACSDGRRPLGILFRIHFMNCRWTLSMTVHDDSTINIVVPIIIRWPSYWPHYASCVTVCPSVPHGLVTRKQKSTKSKLAQMFPRARLSGLPISSWKKFKVTGRQNPQKIGVLFTYGRLIKRGWVRRRLQTRPTPLLGLIYCPHRRRSATGRTAAYHVGSRWRHTFLLLWPSLR